MYSFYHIQCPIDLASGQKIDDYESPVYVVLSLNRFKSFFYQAAEGIKKENESFFLLLNSLFEFYSDPQKAPQTLKIGEL